MNIGQKIMEGIISGGLCHGVCAEDKAHGIVITWSSGAAEQIEAMARNGERVASSSHYPDPCPESVKKRLLPIAMMAAEEVGHDAARYDIVLTQDVITLVTLALLGTAVCAAHDTLTNRETLIADPQVKKWIDAPNAL